MNAYKEKGIETIKSYYYYFFLNLVAGKVLFCTASTSDVIDLKEILEKI